MSDPFLAEIKMFAGNFAPQGWAFCNGQLIAISQNTALFSLLGTTYGGNGQTTFGLPELRGRAPMGAGSGPGLSQRFRGELNGVENVTLTASQMPTHSHSALGSPSSGTQGSPAGATWASSTGGRVPPPLYQNTTNTAMRTDLVGLAGGNQPHSNLQPYLVVTFIIALQGIFPSQ